MRIGRTAGGRHSLPKAATSLLAAWSLTLVIVPAAMADSHYFVTPDGKRYQLARSTTECAVVLRNADEAKTCGQRLKTAGLGTLDRFDVFPRGAMFRFTAASVSPQLTAGVLSDPNINAVRGVYRFDGEDAPVISSGQIVLKLRPGTSDIERDAMFREYALGIVRAMKRLADTYVVQPLLVDSDVSIAERLAYDARTVWANPNFIMPTRTTQATFSDEFFDLQWHHENTGQTGGTVDADIDTPQAWEITTGSGVRVGMLDEGVDVDHEDLSDRYLGVGQDVTLSFFEDDFTNPRPKIFFEAHGTAVMGLIVASANSVGVRGVAPSARFTASRGIGLGATSAELASAFGFAVDQKVDVHNNSWGFSGRFPDPPVIVDAIRDAFENGRDLDGPGGKAPLGMVILFAAGNSTALNEAGFELSALSQVIGVEAADTSDVRASFSNFGPDMDIMAPGGGDINLGVTTTDNSDGCCFFDDNGDPTTVPDEAVIGAFGYNLAGRGRDPFFGFEFGPDIDPEGAYTGFFGGTSAACPIASGVAALVLSVNPNLTATQVRLLMQHSTNQVSPGQARYDAITGFSAKYAYGRINAHKAVLAAQDSLSNGGFSWPDVIEKVELQGTDLSWVAGSGTTEFFVAQSSNVFEFIPQDGVCYDRRQAGCNAGALVGLPDGVAVAFVGCVDTCGEGTAQSIGIERPQLGSRTLAIYARNVSTGRYGYGSRTRVDSARAPSVVINVSPLEGDSPLTVTFQGNAVSELAIDDTSTEWDFDTSDGVSVDATDRTTTNTYRVGAGLEAVFTARLTMFDVEGNPGTAEVTIRVTGPALQSIDLEGGPSDLAVVAARPGSPGIDVSEGPSPLILELSVRATQISGTLQSVSWDLGDGNRATGLVVPHTYINESDAIQRLAVTATVTTTTSLGQTISTPAFKILDVQPGEKEVDLGDPTLPGTTPIGGVGSTFAPCGAAGMIPLLFLAFSLSLLRRGRRRE